MLVLVHLNYYVNLIGIVDVYFQLTDGWYIFALLSFLGTTQQRW